MLSCFSAPIGAPQHEKHDEETDGEKKTISSKPTSQEPTEQATQLDEPKMNDETSGLGINSALSAIGDYGGVDEEKEASELEYEDDEDHSLFVLPTGISQAAAVSNSCSDDNLKLPASSPPGFASEYPSSSPPSYAEQYENKALKSSALEYPEQIDCIRNDLSSSPPILPPYTSSPSLLIAEEMEDDRISSPAPENPIIDAVCDGNNQTKGGSSTDFINDKTAMSVEKKASSPRLAACCVTPEFPLEKGSEDIKQHREQEDDNSLPSIRVTHDREARGVTPLQPSLPITEKESTTGSPPFNEQGGTSKKRSGENLELEESPAPKRMSAEMHKKQHKKLSTPFRSPLLQKPDPRLHAVAGIKESVMLMHSVSRSQTLPSSNEKKEDTGAPVVPCTDRPKFKGLLQSTSKAASQFKSPLRSDTCKTTSDSTSIKALDAQLQTLKRAVQLKKNREAEKLEALIKQWREAGREIAWDLWAIVRERMDDGAGNCDSNYPGTNLKSNGYLHSEKQGFDSGWGWANNASLEPKSNWGWDNTGKPDGAEEEIEVNSQELMSPSKLETALYKSLSQKTGVRRQSLLPPTPRGAYFEQQRLPIGNNDDYECSEDNHGRGTTFKEDGSPVASSCSETLARSLGGMLTQFGIAHHVLGWCEDEGDFIDT